MTMAPILWGASLACALGGAIAGNALGSTPAIDRAAIGMYYQSHESVGADREQPRALPDHYPLVTRNGVVPVAQLSDRGLFSQARYRSFAFAADYASSDRGAGIVENDRVEPMLVQSAAMETDQSAIQPLPLASGPVQVAGNAKIIDVQATLAMR